MIFIYKFIGITFSWVIKFVFLKFKFNARKQYPQLRKVHVWYVLNLSYKYFHFARIVFCCRKFTINKCSARTINTANLLHKSIETVGLVDLTAIRSQWGQIWKEIKLPLRSSIVKFTVYIKCRYIFHHFQFRQLPEQKKKKKKNIYIHNTAGLDDFFLSKLSS